jgi:hypothetical protein
MTGTDLCVDKPHKSRSYLNHLVFKVFQHEKVSILSFLFLCFIKYE